MAKAEQNIKRITSITKTKKVLVGGNSQARNYASQRRCPVCGKYMKGGNGFVK